MNYTKAVEYILDIPKFTSKNPPEHTAYFIDKLGSPGMNRKIIHVAGTNGKGSVCSFLAAIFQEAGIRTGLFTSPHLVRINERFRIGQDPVDDDLFLEAFVRVKQVADEMTAAGFPHPTFFEVLFAMGMLIFDARDVEYIILETGMGGRLDATNQVKAPKLSILTSISLDHTEILGSTVAEIAAEKAGIIKEEVPVVYDSSDAAVSAVIEQKVQEKHCFSYHINQIKYEIFENSGKMIDFSLKTLYDEYTNIRINSPAEYQVRNAVLAVLGAELLKEPRINREIIVRGIARMQWHGRMEQVTDGVYLDGAHNEAGIEEFINTVRRIGEDSRIILLFGAAAEKDTDSMIEKLCRRLRIDYIVTTEIDSDRAVSAKRLKQIFKSHTERPVEAVPAVTAAWRRCMELKDDKSLVFCAGSLYLIGELKSLPGLQD